jgi:hypothetical protein
LSIQAPNLSIGTDVNENLINIGQTSQDVWSMTTIRGNISIPNANQVEQVTTTETNIISGIDPTTCIHASVFFLSDSSTRYEEPGGYILPTGCPIGFTITIKNSSINQWIILNTETNGRIYGNNTTVSSQVYIEIDEIKRFEFIGIITIDQINCSVWIV